MNIVSHFPRVSTPSGNTGLKLQPASNQDPRHLATPELLELQPTINRVSQDWLQGVIPCQAQEIYEIRDYVVSLLQDTIASTTDIPIFRGRWFNDGWSKTCRGAFFCFNKHENGQAEILFSINGDALQSPGQQSVIELLTSLLTINAHITRLDLALDDFTRTNLKPYIDEAYAAGNIVGFQAYDPRDPQLAPGISAGWSCYLGSMDSDKYLIIYDKATESNGQITATRLELRTKRKVAHETAVALVDAYRQDEDLYLQMMRGFILGAVDFRDRAADSNVSRCPQLAWWSDFIVKMESLPLKLPRPSLIRTIQKTINWITEGVETSLAMVKEYMGEGFFMWMQVRLAEGKRRMGDRHFAILKQATGGMYESCPA